MYGAECVDNGTMQDISAVTRPAILIAEDDEDLRAWLREVLVNEGYAVRDAANGREAMDILCRASIDLCITDLAMPEQEGIETIQLIRCEYPHLKIIAMSGSFGPEILRTSRVLGAAASLSKPVDACTLINTIEQVLNLPSPTR